MQVTGGDVAEFIAAVTPARRRTDAATMTELMARVTGLDPTLWGTIVGFGSYHYAYASGREGDAPAAAFAPRKTATVVYLADGIGAHAESLAELGPHTTGVGCLYLKNLDDVDLTVLAGIIAASFATVTAGTYPNRARDNSP